MTNSSDSQTEALLAEETRTVRDKDGHTVEVTGSRLLWAAVEECEAYGWSEAELVRLTLKEAKETGRDPAECFGYLTAYVQADARHVVAAVTGPKSDLPPLLSNYQPRERPKE